MSINSLNARLLRMNIFKMAKDENRNYSQKT